ncbi:hypothetical protein [Sinorhizobium meliloti]|uniref:hypothetical protein n=1 Tax=Rhizobium meliloti TaxID=382 RepID=UPI0013E33CD8|nr:hypothetical protein [Sinorhizobium meliloti]
MYRIIASVQWALSTVALVFLCGLQFGLAEAKSTSFDSVPAQVYRVADRTQLQRLSLCLNYFNTEFDVVARRENTSKVPTRGPLEATAGVNSFQDYGMVADAPRLWQACLPVKSNNAPRVSAELSQTNDRSGIPPLVFRSIGASKLPKKDYRVSIEALAHLLNLPENRAVKVRVIGHASCLHSPEGWVARGAPANPSQDAAFQDLNLRLSLQRAEFVRSTLTSSAWTHGNPVRAQRIVVEGRGFFEPRNGSDFSANGCDAAARRATEARRRAQDDKALLAQVFQDDPEQLQQRVEIAIESPIGVRYGLRAEDQTVSRVVADRQEKEDPGRDPQQIVRFFPLGVRPSEYHTIDLGLVDDIFSAVDSSTEGARQCWLQHSGWLQLRHFSELDHPDGGNLWVRFRFAPRLSRGHVRHALLLDLLGRELGSVLSTATKTEQVVQQEATPIRTLSIPAHWSLRNRISPLLSALITGVDRDQVTAALKAVDATFEFPQVPDNADHAVLQRVPRSCLKLVANTPGTDEQRFALRERLSAGLGEVFRLLPQTSEDLLARIAELHPHQRFARIRAGMRLCVQPAMTHEQPDSSNSPRVGLGISERICAAVMDLRGDTPRPALHFAPANNPVLRRAPPPFEAKTNFGGITVATNWSELLFSTDTSALTSTVFVFWPRQELYDKKGETFQLGQNREWGELFSGRTFYLAGFASEEPLWPRLNALLSDSDEIEITKYGCMPLGVANETEQKAAIKSLLLSPHINTPGMYWWLLDLVHRPLVEASRIAGDAPRCALVPRRSDFALQIPVSLKNGVEYFDLGMTLGEIARLLRKGDPGVATNVRSLVAFRNVFDVPDSVVLDSDQSVADRVPLLEGDSLPW